MKCLLLTKHLSINQWKSVSFGNFIVFTQTVSQTPYDLSDMRNNFLRGMVSFAYTGRAITCRTAVKQCDGPATSIAPASTRLSVQSTGWLEPPEGLMAACMAV
eukprot:scaffold42818_cov34-Prasinocladus_malaysianus.AAC.2